MMMQYGLVVMIVIVAVSAMSVFVQRALKARVHDAQTHMVDWVRREAGEKPFVLRTEYEPYYLESRSDRSVATESFEQHIPEGSGGYVKNETREFSLGVVSNTASPRLAD